MNGMDGLWAGRTDRRRARATDSELRWYLRTEFRSATTIEALLGGARGRRAGASSGGFLA